MHSESTVNSPPHNHLLVFNHSPIDEQQLLRDAPLRHKVLAPTVAPVVAAPDTRGEARDEPVQFLVGRGRKMEAPIAMRGELILDPIRFIWRSDGRCLLTRGTAKRAECAVQCGHLLRNGGRQAERRSELAQRRRNRIAENGLDSLLHRVIRLYLIFA